MHGDMSGQLPYACVTSWDGQMSRASIFHFGRSRNLIVVGFNETWSSQANDFPSEAAL